MTTWSSLVVGKFKMYHPGERHGPRKLAPLISDRLILPAEVHSIADVGYMWGGVAGREFLGAIFWICAWLRCP